MKKTVLAGDLGGTKCRFALVTEDWRVLAVQRFDTIRVREPFVQAMDAAFAAILAARPADCAPPTAIGLGSAGVIPLGGRRIAAVDNLPLAGFELAEHLEQRFCLGTTVLNDGRASALGEWLRGHAAGRDPLLCLFLGTGIGIGLIADGRPFAGAHNAAGEIGHTTWRPGRRCPCGGDGHFEAWCGGRAITERARSEIGALPSGGDWTVGAVVQSTHPAARAILADAEAAFCAMVANACTLLDPAAVVLGGGVLAGWPDLRGRIEHFVRTNCSAQFAHELVFVESLGDSDAILWGAAAATGAFAR